MRCILPFLIITLTVHPCHAWSACGHHIIAVLAYDLLPQAVEPLEAQFGYLPDAVRVTGRTSSTDQASDPCLDSACIGSHATILLFHP